MPVLRQLVVPLLLVVAWLPACQRSVPSPSAADGGAEQETAPLGTVTLEIQTEAGMETYQVDGVAAGTTVESLMRSIDQFPVTVQGSGLTAFVDRIGDKSTSGSAGWTFRVDGEFANHGIGSVTLAPPTTVRWSFADASELPDGGK
jgi:hypothetical protein